jgi:hypothetical protein
MAYEENPQRLEGDAFKSLGAFFFFMGLGILVYAVDYAQQNVLSGADAGWNGVYLGFMALLVLSAFSALLSVFFGVLGLILNMAKSYAKGGKTWQK